MSDPGFWPPCKLLQEAGLPEPVIKPERLELPAQRARCGKEAGAQGGGAAAGAPPESCCVWLTGVPVAVGETELVEAFSQFGHPQKVGKRPAAVDPHPPPSTPRPLTPAAGDSSLPPPCFGTGSLTDSPQSLIAALLVHRPPASHALRFACRPRWCLTR